MRALVIENVIKEARVFLSLELRKYCTCCIISTCYVICSVLLFVCGLLAPGKLLQSLKEAISDPLAKHLQFSCVTKFGRGCS